MKYELLCAESPKKLSKLVQEYFDDGWELHGTTFAKTEEVWGHFKKAGERTTYYQAVVLKEKVEN